MLWLGSFLGAREMAEANFKRDGDGWIFQTPAMRQFFGLQRAYRVDDGQKETLKEFFTRAYGYCLLSVVVVAPVLGGLSVGDSVNWTYLLLSAVVGCAIGIVSWAFYFRAVKRLMPDRQAVDARIAYADSFATSATAMTMPRLLVYFGLSLLMLCGAVLSWRTGGNLGIDLFGVVFFACVTLTFVAMLFVKLRRA